MVAIKANTYMDIACNIIFTQLTVKSDMKKFGETSVAAIFKEFKQLDDEEIPGKSVIIQMDANTLPVEKKHKVLKAIYLIKEKRNSILKERTCANDSSQRQYLKQDESVGLSTASLESIITTLLIDTPEGRDVAIFDEPGA